MLLIGIISCHSETELMTEHCSTPTSHSISIAKARQDLVKLLSDLEGSQTREDNRKMRRISGEYTVSQNVKTRSGEEDSLTLHIFNFENEEGFAMMSGDERLPSLIALTESGCLKRDEENIVNPGVGLFFESLGGSYGGGSERNDSILYPIFDRGNIGDSHYYTYGPWENVIYDVQKCNVKWNQGWPHNIVVNKLYGDSTATGCVPTAIAQLMSVYKYPLSYKGNEFNWDDMIAKKAAYFCSDNAKLQIAQLMAQLGDKENLNTKYGKLNEDGSESKIENVNRTFRAFGYSNGGTVNDYDSSMLIEELKKGFPLLVGGYTYRDRVELIGIKFSYVYSDGHMWLTHGLLERKREKILHNKNGTVISRGTESVYYPLYNWGYGGEDDGYFLVDVFDIKKGSFPEDTRSKEGEKIISNIKLS